MWSVRVEDWRKIVPGYMPLTIRSDEVVVNVVNVV
jgi:hypothetical protein